MTTGKTDARTVDVRKFTVQPCDNGGDLDPAPPRDRTWDVVDQLGRVVSTHETRAAARRAARGTP